MNRPLWWDVPMPPKVAALPRTPSGMPVVYVTDYQQRGADHSAFAPVTPAIGLIDCTCTFGEGTAFIGKLCPRRAADAIFNRKCGVCGTKINPGASAHYVGMTLGTHVEKGSQFYMSREPGAHADCATYSLLTCPQLAARDDTPIVTSRHAFTMARVKGPNGAAFYSLDKLPEAAGILTGYESLVLPSHAIYQTRRRWLAGARPLDRRSLKAVMPARREQA